MKKLLLTLALVMGILTNTFSQVTSLTVDCQYPGWLSSFITYGDQLTLEDLKVTGYINGTDIKFIRELNLNRQLHGCIDLKDVNIVTGGDNYGGSDSYGNPSTTITQDNTLTPYMFAYLKKIRKVILPNSITKSNGASAFISTTVDTLIINGSIESLGVCGGNNNKFWHVRCIYFPEGLKELSLSYLFHPDANLNNIELFFPSTLEKISSNQTCNKEETIIHCESTNPEIILDKDKTGQWGHICRTFHAGKIYVPKGTKEKYEQSIFKNLTIIENIPVEGVSLDENISLYVGDVEKLYAKFQPNEATNQEVIWESNNPEIVEIDMDGTLKAIDNGTAQITATTVDGGYKAYCMVNVYDHTSGVELLDSNLVIPINDEYELNAHTLPLASSDQKLIYSSSDNNVASVNSQGVIKAVAKGSCTITVTSVDGGYQADCYITVIQPVESIIVDKHNISLKVGESDRLNAQISPETADNKTISWLSSNIQIASVDNNGNVTALKAGEAWIKAVSNDNAEAKDSCKVTVIQPVTGITISQESCQMSNIGESIQLEATVLPEDASNKEVRWSSSNESICMVSQGKVIATGYGTAVVIASTVDGGFLASCVVNVEDTSAIQETTVDNQNDSPIYDLMGCKVKKVIKGSLYIQNGQKFIAK